MPAPTAQPPLSYFERLAQATHREVRALDRGILAGAAALFVLFLVLEPILDRATELPLALYEAPSIFGAALTSSPAFLLGWALSALAFLRAPTRTWWRLPRLARWLWAPVLAALFAVGWHLVTVDYNWALGRFYALDRVVLAALAVASALHPAFLTAFVASAHAFAGQLEVPPLHFSWIDTNMLFHVMLVAFLWSALHELRLGGRTLRIPAASAWAVLFGLLGAWYFLPGLGKLRLRWLWENNLAFIFRSAFEQHGWWRSLGPDLHAQVAGFLERFALPMQFAALLAETLVLFFFASRWVTVGVLTLCVGLHTMIALTTGVVFWKWVLVLLALIGVVLAMGRATWRLVFPRWTMMLASLTVLLVYTAVGPRLSILAWYDAPLVYRFRIEVVGESGRRYEATPAIFAPFDSRFAQSRFFFLTDTKRLVDCYGTTYDLKAYRRLLAAETPEDVLDLIDERGQPRTSRERRAELEALLTRFLHSTHERQVQRPPDFGLLKAPLHLWTRQRHDATLPAYTHQEPLQRLEIELVHRHYFDDSYRVIDREPVLTVVHPGLSTTDD